jgi:hypothetical protein
MLAFGMLENDVICVGMLASRTAFYFNVFQHPSWDAQNRASGGFLASDAGIPSLIAPIGFNAPLTSQKPASKYNTGLIPLICS